MRTLVAGGCPRLLLIALNDGIADGRDVSWIWDVDFEPLLGGLERLVASGERAAELALRFTYGGFPGARSRSCPRSSTRSTAALELTPPAASSSCCPPTRRCSRCGRSSAGRGFVAALLGARRVKIASGTSTRTT